MSLNALYHGARHIAQSVGFPEKLVVLRSNEANTFKASQGEGVPTEHWACCGVDFVNTNISLVQCLFTTQAGCYMVLSTQEHAGMEEFPIKFMGDEGLQEALMLCAALLALEKISPLDLSGTLMTHKHDTSER